MTTARRAILIGLVLPLAYLTLLGVGLVFGAANGQTIDVTAVIVTHHRCFPAKKWDAPKGLRPCVEIRRVYEDGSFEYATKDANGTVRYTAGVGALDQCTGKCD